MKFNTCYFSDSWTIFPKLYILHIVHQSRNYFLRNPGVIAFPKRYTNHILQILIAPLVIEAGNHPSIYKLLPCYFQPFLGYIINSKMSSSQDLSSQFYYQDIAQKLFLLGVSKISLYKKLIFILNFIQFEQN